jgi:DNA adenine methylase
MKYPGGKNGNGIYQTIINYIPPHKVYIEPFLGSGAIMRLKKPAEVNIGVEINPVVIAKHSYGSHAIVKNDCAISYLSRCKLLSSIDTLIYVDCPYPMESRRDKINKVYKYEFYKHRELLELLLPLPCMVAISTYPNKLYSDMLKGWNCISFPAQTWAGEATELLYMNYPTPSTRLQLLR